MKKRPSEARLAERLDRGFWLVLGATFLLASAGWADDGSQAAAPSVWSMVRWSPYVVGAGIGVLSWLAFVLSDKPIGVSTAYAQSAGMIEKAIRGSAAGRFSKAKTASRAWPPPPVCGTPAPSAWRWRSAGSRWLSTQCIELCHALSSGAV